MERTVMVFVTAVGEIVCRIKHIDDDGKYNCINPRLFVDTENGSGFIPGVCMTGKQEPTEAIIIDPIMVVEASPETEKAWIQATSGIQLV